MANKSYRLVHHLTGYSSMKFHTYDAAECARGMMDDWMMWDIESYIE